MDIPFFVMLLFIARGMWNPLQMKEYCNTSFALGFIFSIKIIEYKAFRTKNISGVRRFVSSMFRVLNWMWQYMIFWMGWNWEKILTKMPYAIIPSLCAVFIPDKWIQKIYSNNHLLRTLILYEFCLCFAYYLLMSMDTVYSHYAHNEFLFIVVMFFIEGYPTVVVDTIECLLYDKKFPRYSNYLILVNYIPCIVGYLIYIKHQSESKFQRIDFTHESSFDCVIFRNLVIIFFMAICYYDLWYSGYSTSVHHQIFGHSKQEQHSKGTKGTGKHRG